MSSKTPYHPGSLSHVCRRSYPAISVSPWIVHGKPAHTTHWTKPITTSLHTQLVGSFLFSLSVLCSSVCGALTYVCAGESSETGGGVACSPSLHLLPLKQSLSLSPELVLAASRSCLHSPYCWGNRRWSVPSVPAFHKDGAIQR